MHKSSVRQKKIGGSVRFGSGLARNSWFGRFLVYINCYFCFIYVPSNLLIIYFCGNYSEYAVSTTPYKMKTRTSKEITVTIGTIANGGFHVKIFY